MSKIRIAGAVASKSCITLYLENGSQMELVKDSHRTNEIMQEIAKPLAKREVVEIDLLKYSAHDMIEKKTGGLIRFVKDKVSNFLGLKHEEGFFGITQINHDETIVAVVDGKKIPGMEKLDRQIQHAAFSKDAKGFEVFMQRLAAVIDDREHTVQELLTFMQRADLPIADDGSIVAYKTLRYANGKDKTVFVDVHSRMVSQKLGSRVSMPMDKVDENRRVKCSTGLHIARRRYLRKYYGDILTLVKVAPEDVIAVPYGEPDKMRAAAYHIVAVLPDEAATIVRSDKAMTSNSDAAKILADVIAGDHVGVLEEVKISNEKVDNGSHKAKDVVTEPIKDAKPFLGAGDNGMAAALDSEVSYGGGKVDIRALNKKVEEAIAERDAAVKKLADYKVKTKKKKVTKKRKKASSTVVSMTKPKAVDPAQKPLTDAQQRRESAYKAVMSGMSQREASKKFKVCAKTLRKMVKDRAAKAAE